MNELLVYGDIYSFSASEFIKAFSQIEGENVVVRVNTNGGDPQMAFGMAARLKEFSGEKVVKIDGKAYSSGLFFALYADKVEALDVSEFLIHRAAYGDWFEGSEFFTAELKSNLERINKSLEAAFRNKVDVKAFEDMKGVKVKDIFSMDQRLDVFFTAQEAKSIGLVDKIVKITPQKKSKVNALMMSAAAKYTGIEDVQWKPAKETEASNKPHTEKVNSKTNNKMTIEQLKAEHPELFAKVFGDGVKAERDRVGAWLKFNDTDAKAVVEGIESGENLSQTAMADFTVKMVSAQTLAKIKAENPEKVETETVETVETEVEKSINAFKSGVMAELGIKTENK